MPHSNECHIIKFSLEENAAVLFKGNMIVRFMIWILCMGGFDSSNLAHFYFTLTISLQSQASVISKSELASVRSISNSNDVEVNSYTILLYFQRTQAKSLVL